MRRILTFLAVMMTLGAWAQDNRTLAFPTAEGFGKYTSGGRGGKVVEVTKRWRGLAALGTDGGWTRECHHRVSRQWHH